MAPQTTRLGRQRRERAVVVRIVLPGGHLARVAVRTALVEDRRLPWVPSVPSGVLRVQRGVDSVQGVVEGGGDEGVIGTGDVRVRVGREAPTIVQGSTEMLLMLV